MKKFILLLAIAGFFTQTQAQKLVVKDVPVTVISAFTESYASIADAVWSKDGNNYVAKFEANSVDTSVTYDASGALVQTKVGILDTALPAPVMEYVNKNYKGNELQKVSQITDAKGVVTYKLKVKDMDLIFDSEGKFIK